MAFNAERYQGGSGIASHLFSIQWVMTDLPRWGPLERVLFVLAYAWAKLWVLREVRDPRWNFFAFEWHYSLVNLLNTLKPGAAAQVYYKGPARISTVHGQFAVRVGTQDAAIISPAFERTDMNRLIRVAHEQILEGQRVAFLDIGANIGQFTVRIGRHFGLHPALHTWAFEPVPQNLEWLNKNLRLNEISDQQVTVRPCALSDAAGELPIHFNERQPGDSTLSAHGQNTTANVVVKMRTADQELGALEGYSFLLLKIDVEGHEIPVLKGMRELLRSNPTRPCVLCVEDIFVRPTLYAFLQSIGFRAIGKHTPYNSWWGLNYQKAAPPTT